jgi:ABC-type multidrug transport system ATPase subunit
MIVRLSGLRRGEARARAAELLDQFDLADAADRMLREYSGGMRRRLDLAAGLVTWPPVLFLDEPTTGLDPQARRGIWEVIRQLRREGRTVFLTTHYLEEAELLADQVAIINHGKIIAAGTPPEIIRQHGRPERLAVEGPASLAEFLKTRVGRPVTYVNGHVEVSMQDKSDALTVLQAIESSGLPWKGFATVSDTLEDVFVTLVGRMDEGELKSAGAAAA